MITQAIKLSIKQSSGKKHKRTRQEVSAKLKSYIYKVHMVHATNSYTCPYVYTTTSCVMEHFGPNILFFFYLFFFWFYFSFSFSFSFRTMKKAHDKEVTWQVTWCVVISLELDERVWKMMSGHLEYTWWPWVEHEAGMRMKYGHKGRVIY